MKIKIEEIFRNKAVVPKIDYDYAIDMNERIVIECMNQTMTMKPKDIIHRLAFIDNDKVYFWWRPDSFVENVKRPHITLQDGARRSKYLQA